MLEIEHGFRVVDVHARLTAAAGTPVAGRTIDADGLEREMHQAGIVRAVVFADPQPEGGYLRANNAVARRAVERPFVAFARVSGPRDGGDDAASRIRNLTARRKEWHTSPEDVEQYAYDDRFYGFKLHPACDGLPDDEVLTAMDDVCLPALVHGGRGFPPDAVADALLDREFPVVLAHFGGHPLDRELMDRAIDLLDAHDGLYLDTSVVRYREQLERAIMEHPDRVVFGSGAPAVHPNVAIMEVLTLDVPEDAMRRVFSKNVERIGDGAFGDALRDG
jgi:predicted TIM-barrel fold metal-dependent hydrolase